MFSPLALRTCANRRKEKKKKEKREDRYEECIGANNERIDFLIHTSVKGGGERARHGVYIWRVYFIFYTRGRRQQKKKKEKGVFIRREQHIPGFALCIFDGTIARRNFQLRSRAAERV